MPGPELGARDTQGRPSPCVQTLPFSVQVHFHNFYYIENKNKTPWKLLGREDAQVHVVEEAGFQRDRNSAGWGRSTGTVLISILAAASTPLIWRLSTTEVQF